MSAVAADLTDKVVVRPSPFPGLRPFEAQESYLFFGRDGQSQAVIDLLAAEHFVAVVGTSGSGKSSLVRAGVIPSLRRGLMAPAGPEWRVAVMGPGNKPIRNLATTLDCSDAFGPLEGAVSPIQMALTEAVLRRGNRGLVDFVQQNSVERGANVLVLVDQFEELFRFQREAARSENGSGNYQNEAAAFVKLL